MTTPQVDTGYLTREDESLKAALSVVKLNDPNSPPGGRAVPVFFRTPEDEARARVYPYIVIDMLTPVRDPGREHRGPYYFDGTDSYKPVNLPSAGRFASTDFPIPMSHRYQISAVSRFYQHDRQMTVALISGPLEPRFGSVLITASAYASDDMTIRRLDIEDGPRMSPTRDGDGKRVFRTVWTVAMSSEIFESDIVALDAPTRVVIQTPTETGFVPVS